jgi:hypothetical protein
MCEHFPSGFVNEDSISTPTEGGQAEISTLSVKPDILDQHRDLD